MRKKFDVKFEDIISIENLLLAWSEFVRGKRGKQDVQKFSLYLMDNILLLHEHLVNKTYTHGSYHAFSISDPKPRSIHKATVRDRLLHHAIHRIVYPFFDKVFTTDSFSCRAGKGTHAALKRFRAFGYEVSKNNTKTCWILKCDIKKFFANIDHEILIEILRQYISGTNNVWLFQEIIESFNSGRFGIGVPLGNLTSQLFVNIYMNEFDQFVKHKLKARHYIRYADDFVIFEGRKDWLETLIPKIRDFLKTNLKLELHPQKISLKTLASGVDFLGWVHFLDHRILRTATERRMVKRIQKHPTEKTINSYLGLLKHGNAYKLKKVIAR